VLRTTVSQSLSAVNDGFTQDLFLRLAPPFPKVALVRYDGSQPGDQVHVRLNFGLFKQDWVSRIVSRDEQPQRVEFVDRGEQLPFFLRFWEHHHILEAAPNGGTVIVDDIRYKGPWFLPSALLWPAMWGQFVYRKPIYRRVFREP